MTSSTPLLRRSGGSAARRASSPSSIASSRHSPSAQSRAAVGVPASSLVEALPTRSQTPLQPAWLSIQSTAMPAAWTTSSRFSCSAWRFSNAALPSEENMQGTEASVLVPHDQTLRKLRTPRAASSGVVSRA